MILTIAMRELRSLFVSPLAWVMLTITQFILAGVFLHFLGSFYDVQDQLATMPNAPGVTDMIIPPLMVTFAFLLLIIVPLLSMRLIAEEARSQTLSLLFSAPVSMTEIVLGKFVSIMVFLSILLILLILMPLSLYLGGNMDFGVFAAGILGLILLSACYSALGLFMSSITSQPIIAAISSFGLLLLLWILELASTSGEKSELFSQLSLLGHYQSMLKGIVNSSDVIYYLLFICFFLILSIRQLDAKRLQS